MSGSREIHRSDWAALAAGLHKDPFSVLGVHRIRGRRWVRTFQPQAATVELIDAGGRRLAAMRKTHPEGGFEAPMPPRLRRYGLLLTGAAGNSLKLEDPYRFPSYLRELDLYLLGQGRHEGIQRLLGAQPMTLQGVKGTGFALWAPAAARVSVVGDFNDWDGRRHVMRFHPGCGVWEIFLPQVEPGAHYKYEIVSGDGKLLPLKADPLARYCEAAPGNASIVYQSRYRWDDQDWMSRRRSEPPLDQPLSIYEVHLGSWQRIGSEARQLSYRELAGELVSYVQRMGFTHIELLPVSEHPFEGSWGYQPLGMYAPTQRFGEPDDFRYLVDCCHRAGIGVILDWVPAHFPKDSHGLARFDGSPLYEYADPNKAEHGDWGTLVFDYEKPGVVNYLLGSALSWLEEFHIDGLRVDAVASMLYLDYSRATGQWTPNRHGGNENLEAIEFLRYLNTVVHARGAICLAEESTAWPNVSRPADSGGLGFSYKWNMGWMHDSLNYMQEDPLHRRHHHERMTFGLVYAFSENFVLPLSHDEVVHGKGSLLGRMPGDHWQQLANLRAYYGFMFAHPGKKLLFMGAEIAQEREWNHQQSLDWHLLQQASHRGVQRLIRDLNRLYCSHAALHQQDCSSQGFRWIQSDDRDNSVFAWLRFGSSGEFIIFICNFTPVVRHEYRLGVPAAGDYHCLLNTDAQRYAGSGAVDFDRLPAEDSRSHGMDWSLRLTLPPLASLMIAPARPDPTAVHAHE